VATGPRWGSDVSEHFDESRFWISVKFNVPDPADEAEFHTWYDAHVGRIVSGPGYQRGYRSEESVGLAHLGGDEQRFWAVVTMGSLERFARPAPSPSAAPPPRSDGPRYGAILDRATDHGRLAYRIDRSVERELGDGRFLAREEYVRIDGGPEQEAEMAAHVDACVGRVGVHRAWQMTWVPGEQQIGPDPAGAFLNIYEVDAPEHLLDDGALTTFGAGLDGFEPTRVGFAEVLYATSTEIRIARAL
jgi:hypothetical protein